MQVIENINSLYNNFEPVATLKKNENLFQWRGRFSTLSTSNSILKGCQNNLLITVHKIITAARLVFKELIILLTFQSTKKDLSKIKGLTAQLSNILEEDFSDLDKKNHYHLLRKLGKIRLTFHKALDSGLPNYKKNLETGSDRLFKGNVTKREEYAHQVQEIIKQIETHIIPSLDCKIHELEEKCYGQDLQNSREFLNLIVINEPFNEKPTTNTRFCNKAVKKCLSEIYGNEAADRAFNYYDLNGETVIYQQDILSLLCGIAANITNKDLKVIYDQKPKLLFDRLDDAKIRTHTDFQNLTEQEVCYFVQSIRKVPLIQFPASYKQQLDHDQKLLRCLSQVNEFISCTDLDLAVKDFKKFSYTEYLARELSYHLFDQKNVKFPDGILIPIHEKNSGFCLKEAYHLVSDNGVNGAILKNAKPTNRKQTVQVIFRGTYCKQSVFRNINPVDSFFKSFYSGPGRKSYTAKQDDINNGIRFHLNTLKGKQVALEFIGHSLGATDAQRALEYFTYRLADDKRSYNGTLKLYAYNSPGIETDLINRFIGSVNKLDLQFKLRYFDVHHDPVQEFGTKRIGYCGFKTAKPENLSISVFRFNRKLMERVRIMAQHFFKRIHFHFSNAFEAHTAYCLRLHETVDSTKLNATYCQDIYTNYDQDVEYRYGSTRHKRLNFVKEIDMDDHLVTKIYSAGRKMRKWTGKAIHIISFGHYTKI